MALILELGLGCRGSSLPKNGQQPSAAPTAARCVKHPRMAQHCDGNNACTQGSPIPM